MRLLLLCLTLWRSHAQRAELCLRAEAIKNGVIDQAQGLKGVHLNIGSGLYDDRFLRRRNDETDAVYRNQ